MRETSQVDRKRAVGAGLAAGSAFLCAMWLDNRLSSREFNDLKLVGQAFTVKSPWWIIQGLMGHYAFSVMMGLAYARFGYGRLPGPGVLQGIVFINIENAALYPFAVVVDRVHAGVKEGQLPPLLDAKTFAGQVVRHIAFGAVLGLVYEPADRG